MTIKGGSRPGAGRKKGSPNKATQQRQAAVQASGITPLEYMLNIMRAEFAPTDDFKTILARETLKFEAARAAAPYVHPRLHATTISGDENKPVNHRVIVEFIRAAAHQAIEHRDD